MIMLSRHLIIVIVSFLLLVFIYSSSSTFDVFAVPPDPRYDKGRCTINEKTYDKTCCWRVYIPGKILGESYCQTCSKDKNGDYTICKPKEQQKIITQPLPPTVGESVLPGDGGVLEQPPNTPRGNDANVPLEGGILEQQEQPLTSPQLPNQGGLLCLLDDSSSTIQLDDDSTIPPSKGNKGLLGLLDENSPTLQQQPSLPETIAPQRTSPNTDDLLSNLDDNLFTNVPNEENSEPLNLLEENKPQQEFTITETDSDNANTVKEVDKEDNEKEDDEQKQQPSSEEQIKEQQEITANQEDNEIESEEVEEEEDAEQQQPPLAETINPNTEFVN